MIGSAFDGANLSGIVVQGGDWSFVNLRFQDLDGLDLREVRFKGADFAGASMKKCDLRDSVLDGASVTNLKLQKSDFRGASLNEVDLRTADLKGARFDIPQAIHFAQCFGIIVE